MDFTFWGHVYLACVCSSPHYQRLLAESGFLWALLFRILKYYYYSYFMNCAVATCFYSVFFCLSVCWLPWLTIGDVVLESIFISWVILKVQCVILGRHLVVEFQIATSTTSTVAFWSIVAAGSESFQTFNYTNFCFLLVKILNVVDSSLGVNFFLNPL